MSFQVSVLMPAYNAEGTIGMAISTTLRALSNEDELIVVDDGSEDATHNIISSFADPRIRHLANDKNLGIAKSLNLGLNSARHTFIARVDADDLVPFWRFKTQKALMKRENVDLLFGSQILIRGSLPIFPIYSWISRRSGERFNKAMALSCILAHPTMMGKKDVLLELGGYKNIVAEDYALWLQALLQGRTVLRHWFPQNIYRWSPNSVSKRDASREGHLNHLRAKRKQLFFNIDASDNVFDLSLMKKFRKEMLLKDPFLYLETGIRTDPLSRL